MSYAYVGCRTTKERNARGKGLKVFEINDKTGDWNLIQCLKTEEENPSYQTLDNEGNFLYSVHGDKTKVSSYKILEDGTLSPLNMIDIGGKNPVFITADRTNRFLVVAALSMSLREMKTEASERSSLRLIFLAKKRELSPSRTSVSGIRQRPTFLLLPREGFRDTDRFSYTASTQKTALSPRQTASAPESTMSRATSQSIRTTATHT